MTIYNRKIKRLTNNKQIIDIAKILRSTDIQDLQIDCFKAISILSKKDLVDPTAVNISIKLLQSNNPSVRRFAAFALGDMANCGLYDEICIQPLKIMASEHDKENRWSSIFALMTLTKKGVVFDGALDMFHNKLLDNFDKVTYNSAFAIGHLANVGIINENVLLPLISLLNDRNTYTRKGAAFALSSMAKKGVFHKMALNPSIGLLKDKDKFTRKYALEIVSVLEENGINNSETARTEINISDSIVQRTNIG
ncbi:HEAT repeat domain-containing protein [Methanococcoides methylutens]|uniref:Uncharacterized protein n=1 Tax=Methanococcoides methylutens MM1 TaxID=1434104 RepID=A0A0E3SNK8_METMT|nr:HEAT repeat domain-containing protein [Methanococcoides methylutens]AKB84136.1 hypothetical protein MCMEM_0083 [Methanococcoides methylutens MM1]